MALCNNFEAFAVFRLTVSTRARKMCVEYIMCVLIFGRVFRTDKYLASYVPDKRRTHAVRHVKRSSSLINFTQKWEWLTYVRKKTPLSNFGNIPHAMALGSTQPPTEMSTRNISWGVKATGA